ncbi:hypothetical protein [Pseudomonas sp. NPDC099000]|uniref:hypothetical protein n=1 Tax=Pseudomonas sp. NPDC099000 TaxID=3364488 RepID=UPI00383B71DC
MTYTKICNSCIDALSKRVNVRDNASKFQALLACPNHCCDPSCTVSEHSPHPVTGDEQITACASHPHHTARNGSITHKVFDRAFTQGLSATRINLPGKSLQDVLRFCTVIDESKMTRQPELLSVGVVTLVAKDVRQVKFRDDQQYAFRVYDTAGRDNPAHADIVASKFFGELSLLPKELQSVRTWAQLQLVRKMSPTLGTPVLV